MIRALNVRPQWRLLPPETTEDAGGLLRARALRAFGDGFVSVLLPLHLTTLGFGGIRIGAIATATLIGSAALTLLVGLIAYRIRRRVLLLRAAVLMVATGLGFAFVHDFWPLMLVAFVGTLNPSSGDVSVFLPTEQALLPQTVSAQVATPVAEGTPAVPGAVDILFVQSFATGSFAENTASAGDYTLTLNSAWDQYDHEEA